VDIANLPAHAAARALPPLPPSEYQELVSSIKAEGLLTKISCWRDESGVLWLVDGVHRRKALLEVGVQLRDDLTEMWTCRADEIAARVIAVNLRRRHIASAKERIELARRVLEAAGERITVSKVAAAAQLSHVTIYQHADLLPEGTFCPQGSRDTEIANLLENPAQLPPDKPRSHGGGRPAPLERRIARHLGVSVPLVERVAGRVPTNGNGVNGHHPAEHLNDDDRVLQHVAHELEGLCGADLTDAGAHFLKRCELSLSRIRMEYNTGEACTLASMPAQYTGARA
jgi:hypothetical protein